MNELDETILIAAAPEVVWAQVSDINQNPAWQSDCQSVVFLSKQRSGKGTRWRYRNLSDKEFELEVTAWYDGLGYEYRFLDGSARGRIRLQEIAEGTTVQWTFSYETQGRLGGMRNALGMKRNYHKHLEDSLQALLATVIRTIGNDNTFEARSLMRDSLSYDARANYKSRHPSQARDEKATEPPVQVEEPAPLEEDTRPNPVFADVAEDSPLARQPVESEPAPPAVETEPPRPLAPASGQPEPSIWDVFGLDRPQQEVVAEQPAPEPAPVPKPVVEAPVVVQPLRAAPDPELVRNALLAIRSEHPGLRKLHRSSQARRSNQGPG